MNLIKRIKNNWLSDPLSEVNEIQNSFDDIFGFPFPKLGGYETSFFDGAWVPAIDVHDEKDRYVVKAELPGLEKKNIQVSVNGDILSIKGEKKKDSKVNDANCCRGGYRHHGDHQNYR